jgi:PKD repeat protein
VANGINYTYCVTAVNIIGEGAPSATIWVIPSDYPSAPVMLSAGFLDKQMLVGLDWQPPEYNGGTRVERYIVYRGEGDAAAMIAETGNLSIDDTDISVGMICVYSVSAVNNRGEGDRAGPVSVPVGFPPAAPLDIQCREEDRSLVLDWGAPADLGGFPVTGYRVYRVNDANRTVLLAETRQTTYRDTGLVNGQIYKYRISAINILGEGGSGNASGIPHALPSPPLDLTANIVTERVVLSWGVPVDDGGARISGYNVYVKTSGDFILLGTVGGRTANDTIGAHQIRIYKVTAVSAYGEGAASNETSAALPKAEFAFIPQCGNITTVFAFESKAYDPDGTIVSWSWSFGDGQVATGQHVNHTFTVVLKVKDNSGGESISALSVNISNRAPHVSSATPSSPIVDVALGRSVGFSLNAVDDDNDPLSFDWVFDGLPAGEGRDCRYKARSIGKHVVEVKVSDGESVITRQWSVVVAEPPRSDLGPVLPMVAVAVIVAAAATVGFVLWRRKKKGS